MRSQNTFRSLVSTSHGRDRFDWSQTLHDSAGGVGVREGETVFTRRHDTEKIIELEIFSYRILDYYRGRLPALGMIFQDSVMVTF